MRFKGESPSWEEKEEYLKKVLEPTDLDNVLLSHP